MFVVLQGGVVEYKSEVKMLVKFDTGCLKKRPYWPHATWQPIGQPDALLFAPANSQSKPVARAQYVHASADGKHARTYARTRVAHGLN